MSNNGNCRCRTSVIHYYYSFITTTFYQPQTSLSNVVPTLSVISNAVWNVSLFKGTLIFGKTSLLTKLSSTDTLSKNVFVCFSGPKIYNNHYKWGKLKLIS